MRGSDAQAMRWRDEALGHLADIAVRDGVLCHNDVTAANVIDSGEICLIDWEYAALGDALFDLAVVVAHHNLDDAATAHLLHAYAGRHHAQMTADLGRWCDVYRCVLALWQSLHSAPI